MGRGDGDEHFGLAGVEEALAESFEDRIVTAGGEGGESRRPPATASSAISEDAETKLQG